MAVYLEKTENKIEHRPSHVGEELLLIHATYEECKFYKEMGWNISNLVFSDDLIPENVDVNFQVTSYYGDWHLHMTKNYDHVIVNTWANYVENYETFLKKLKELLTQNGQLKIILNNAKYFVRLINKTTREKLVWPEFWPSGVAYVKDEIEQIDVGLTLNELSYELDPKYHDSNSSRWNRINAFDCAVFKDGNEEDFFGKYFIAHYSFNDPLPVDIKKDIDVEKIHAELEDLFSKGEIDTAGSIVQNLVNNGNPNHQSYNFMGIYFFYKEDWFQAYNYFLKSIELYDQKIDYYYNLYDAAKNLGIHDEVRTLIQQKVAQYPEFSNLIQDLEQGK